MGKLGAGSHPTRDVWVEMFRKQLHIILAMVTSHTGCVSRNSSWNYAVEDIRSSHPTRDVWVEIYRLHTNIFAGIVTSHTGCVSRNTSPPTDDTAAEVTSHTGCVSRNFISRCIKCQTAVTSHTGCVSRNALVYFHILSLAGHIPHGMCE